MGKKKNDKGEPVGWVTVKGKHFPKWADGTIGWQDGQEDEPNKSGNSKTVRTSEIGTNDLEGYEKGTELDVEGTKYTKVGKYWQDKNGKKWDSHKLYKEQLDGDDFDITVTSPSNKATPKSKSNTSYKYGEGHITEHANEVKPQFYGGESYKYSAHKTGEASPKYFKTEKEAQEYLAGGKKTSKAADTKSGYTVMMNTKDGFKEAKTFKSAAEADDYITKQVKSGNGISTDWNIKKNGQSGTSKTSSTKTKDIEKPAATFRNTRYDTSRSTKSNKFKMGMSKEERKQFLDNAPAGTRISGLVDKRTGREMIVEKVEEYRTVYGGVGAGSKIHDTVWKIGGYTEPYIARTLREAEEGTNKYYEFKKSTKRKK